MSEPIDSVLAVAKQYGVGTLDPQVGACRCQDRSGRLCGEGVRNIITPRGRHGRNGSVTCLHPYNRRDRPLRGDLGDCTPGDAVSTSSRTRGGSGAEGILQSQTACDGRLR